MGERMLAGLRRAASGHEDAVVDVRGMGLLIAIEFSDDTTGFEFGERMLDRGVLVSGTLVNARTIRVEPPLTIFEQQADYVCQAAAESLNAIPSKKATTGV